MSMLEKILKDLYVEPEVLAELDDQQKQLLFSKMREEQLRRWLLYEQELDDQDELRPKSQSRVQWLLDDNGQPWVWVMGDQVDGLKTVDEAIRHRLDAMQSIVKNDNAVTTATNCPNQDADQWPLDLDDQTASDLQPNKGIAKIPVSDQVLMDVEREIRLMARRAKEQHRLNNLTAERRLRTTSSRFGENQSHSPTGLSNGPFKVSIVHWYRREEFPKKAGLDKSGRAFETWFHGQLSRQEAECLLAKHDNGAFLIRLSEKMCGYVLSYQAGYKIKHFMVLSSSAGYHFVGSDQGDHCTLNALVDHHSIFPITKSGMEILTRPIGQCKQRPDYAELLDLFQ